MSDEEDVRPRRGKRRTRIEADSSSSSESDSPVENGHKRKKMNVIESESSSADDSDDSSVIHKRIMTRKKRIRVESESSSESESSTEGSEDESEDESCSYEPPSGPQERLSESEISSSDYESETTENDNTDEEVLIQAAIQESLASVSQASEIKNENLTKDKKIIPESAGFASDSSDGQSEKCPICLISFTNQEIGSPETCDHTFCAVCIQEWAKNVNTCPVDRQVFTLILVRKEINGKITRRIPISNQESRETQESDSDTTFCQVCERSDREDRLLLCDGCDVGYHLECLNPPMESVPIEEWFCPECAADNPSTLAEEVQMQEGELYDLLDDLVQVRPRRSRLLPRTRQSERVRANLRSLRLQGTLQPALQPTTSGIESMGADSSSVGSGQRPPAVNRPPVRSKVYRKRTVKKRRKRRTTKKRTYKRKPAIKKRKVTKKAGKGSDEEDSEEIDEYIPQKKRRKRRKRKIRRKKKITRRKVARTATPRSVKGRLAEQLGLCAPSRPGASLPVVRSRATTSDIDLQRSRAGIPTLHIYGPQNELEYFSSDNDNVTDGGVALAARPRIALGSTGRLLARKKLSAAALQSHAAVSSRKPVRNRIQTETDPATSGPVDLIGSILSNQTIWHSKNSSVTIKPDGSLEVNKDPTRTSGSNSKDTVVNVSDANKPGTSLIRSDTRLTDVVGSSSAPLDLGSASARISQAPMYPGQGNNSNRPPSNSGFHQYGGNRYNAPSYSNYQGGRDFTSFSSSSANFNASSTRAGYNNYLNSGLPPAPLRSTPVRFRVASRYPVRRPLGSQRPQDSNKRDDKQAEEAGESSQRHEDEEEDDEIDIYSDIEAGGGGSGSGGPSRGGSEPDEGERNIETSYEALPPPPEPSALLMGFGEQMLSEEEATSDSELVIDDNAGPSSPHDPSESGPQIPESEKYDPAEPLADSDDEEETVKPESVPLPSKKICSDEDDDDVIPFPPEPPASMPFPSALNISQHINSSSNSNNSYLHSPTYGETSFESEKLSTEGVVNKIVKEVISERLECSSVIIDGRNDVGRGCPTRERKEEDNECPNFSIYSAASMDIARRTEEESAAIEKKDMEDEIINLESDDASEEDKEIERKSDGDISESEDPVKKINKSPSNLAESKPVPEMQDIKMVDGKTRVIDDTNFEKDGEIMDTDSQTAENDTSVDDSPVNKSSESVQIDEIKKLHEDTKDLETSEGIVKDQEISDDESNEGSTEKQEENNAPFVEKMKPESNIQSAETKGEVEDVCVVKHTELTDVEGKKRGSASSSKDSEDKSEKGSEDKLPEDTFDSDDDIFLCGDGKSISLEKAPDTNNAPTTSVPIGLEGLETETISETEEAINFDDSQDENELVSADEDGANSLRRKKRKKSRDGKITIDSRGERASRREHTPPEEGEIVDERPKPIDSSDKSLENLDSLKHGKEAVKVSDENCIVSKAKDDDKKKKKKEKRKSAEKEDQPILASSENKRKSKEKRVHEDASIAWKKPSKSTKERNYRDTKATKADDASKDKDRDKGKGKEKTDEANAANGKRKKKEKRKDMERYDVRKIVSDKRRRRKDEFGRDLSRDRSFSRTKSRSRTHSRSRSYRRSRDRSRSLSKSRRHRSPVRTRRSRSRSRYRSRSRSYRRSRSKSKNRSKRKSKDRNRRSRSKERTRSRVSRSRSRGRRSRSRSGSHNRSKNKNRLRSRSRSPLKQRKDRLHSREVQRFHGRRSWSRTWTPSWSRSRSRSISCSSFTPSRSPSARRFNRSFSRSFSRSWSRERYERLPLEKAGALSSKAPKKLTVIVNNTKNNSDRPKKDKKKKKDKKNKDGLGAVEKRKKRKEKSPAPSKEVFTSGDNILVSVNFNKTSKSSASKDLTGSALTAHSKDVTKRKREDLFETDREVAKKIRKEKNKEKNKAIQNEKGSVVTQTEKKAKKQAVRDAKSARMAAILKQKPVAIIDLDQSPFREQTPSPRDLIVLSDSDDENARNKVVDNEEIVEHESLSVCRGLRPDSSSPQSPAKGVHNVPTSISVSRSPESDLKLMSAVSNYLNTSTGPKTPPEPQIKFSIASKQPQLRVINNPLQEEDDAEDAGLDDSDQRIEEELDRNLGDIVHKGPNTPPEPRGPTTPRSPPISPDAYDPFDPTKSGTPSPAGPEASMDGPPSPLRTPADDLALSNARVSTGRDSPIPSDLEDLVCKNTDTRSKSPPIQPLEEALEEICVSPDRTKSVTRDSKSKSPVGIPETVLTPQRQNEELPPVSEIPEVSKTSLALPPSVTSVPEGSTKSPDRKMQNTPIKAPVFPVPSIKQVSTSQQSLTSTPSHAAPPPIFPPLTPVNIASMLCTPTANLGLNRNNLFTPPAPLSVPSLLQHVSSAVAPVQTWISTDKPVTTSAPLRLVQNGEQLPKPVDTTTEVVDMDLDSPYSPGSSEGDDLFDPPADTPTRSNQSVMPGDRTKSGQPPSKNSNKLAVPISNLPSHKSPSKSQDKFDTLFTGAGAPNKISGSTKAARSKGLKGAKTKAKHIKGGKKEIAIKMDEDQLQILDELPSSAVELQVKDKFLKKLNRQERVVEEVKLSLKPHYNRKHITKEEYKDILRKSVPKICHNKSGEINPVKIATLVEAYVRKVRYEKKKRASASSTNNSIANPTAAKPKAQLKSDFTGKINQTQKRTKTTKWS